MKISRATHGQLLRIVEIYSACKTCLWKEDSDQWTEDYPGPEFTAEDIAAGTLFVMTENDRPVGVVNLSPEDEPECGIVDWEDPAGRFLVASRLAVTPEMQKQGLGRSLMDFAEDFARNGGYTSLRLLAYKGNGNLLRWYEMLGYKRRRCEVWCPGRRHPFLAYEKLLTSTVKFDHNNILKTMKKVIMMAAVAVMAAMSASANAQEKKDYGKFDFEIGYQVSQGSESIPAPNYTYTPYGYVEARWQLNAVPVDLGAHIGVALYKRTSGDRRYSTIRTFPIMAVGDWQFGRGAKVNPYVGLGLGYAEVKDATDWSSSKWSPAISPRLGVRFFKCANLSVGWLATDIEYSRLYCNLGFYF
jgi:GNAT superfamily N-acetyltransferase